MEDSNLGAAVVRYLPSSGSKVADGTEFCIYAPSPMKMDRSVLVWGAAMRTVHRETSDTYGMELAARGAERVVCCPQCGRQVRAWWAATDGNDLAYGVRPLIDDERRYRQWLETNRPLHHRAA